MADEITDEMVKKAFEAWWDTSHEDGREGQMRAALEAVAPLIRAQGMEAAEKIVHEERCERGTPWDLACTTIAEKIRLARAAELEKTTP